MFGQNSEDFLWLLQPIFLFDFNFNFINMNNARVSAFKDICVSCSLHTVQKLPRSICSTNQTLLDILLSNVNDKITSFFQSPGIADHEILRISLNLLLQLSRATLYSEIITTLIKKCSLLMRRILPGMIFLRSMTLMVNVNFFIITFMIFTTNIFPSKRLRLFSITNHGIIPVSKMLSNCGICHIIYQVSQMITNAKRIYTKQT